MPHILVVGGAGYIGSHMVKMLGRQGYSVTTLDDLSSGHRDAVVCGEFVQADMGDRSVLDVLLARGFDAVMHFASFLQVGESLQGKRAANPSRLGESNQVEVGASQRCGSNSSKRELGQVGNLISTSFR